MNQNLWICVVFVTLLIGEGLTRSVRRYTIEGDILLRRTRDAGLRTVLSEDSYRWPSGVVPYAFVKPEKWSEWDRFLIKSAMDEIESNSCIRFVERNAKHEDYVIIRDGTGCAAEVGRQGGSQELSLEAPICMSKGVILHELLHALGYVHEQTRTDRDDYVKINWDNISEHNKQNFEKYPWTQVDALEQPYDFQSVMHYEYNALAEDGSEPTLEPLDDRIELQDLGRAKKLGVLTKSDKLKLNSYYKCLDDNKL